MREPPRQPRRILVVAPAWVGDMIMAHSLLQLLAARHGGAEIHAVAPPATAPLAERMPELAAVRRLDAGHGETALRHRYRLGRSLRPLDFDWAIVLPNTLKSALVPFWAGVPVRTGWLGEQRYVLLNDRRRLDPGALPSMVSRFVALGLPAEEPLPSPLPVPELAVDADNRERLIAELGLEPARALALCPGAEYGPAKRWPAAHYAALARAALAEGRQVWLLGSPGEAATCESIRALAPGALNLAGRTSLTDAVDLLAAAAAVVSNDSGLMHAAAAVGVPVVGVYGSTSPIFTPPLGPRARTVCLALPCSPCFQRTCPLGHRRCLEDLLPERVAEAL